MIHLQCENKKKKAELKLVILHKGKAKRYPHGATDAQKLKEKIAYTGLIPGDEFMVETSLLVAHHYSLNEHQFCPPPERRPCSNPLL